MAEEISELRIQTGYFSHDALGLFLPTFLQLTHEHRLTRIIIGSNDGCTLGSHVAALAQLLGLPRPNAQLGVVQFAGAFFHPKVYYFQRADGTRAAYVGSANLTPAACLFTWRLGSLWILGKTTRIAFYQTLPTRSISGLNKRVPVWFSSIQQRILRMQCSRVCCALRHHHHRRQQTLDLLGEQVPLADIKTHPRTYKCWFRFRQSLHSQLRQLRMRVVPRLRPAQHRRLRRLPLRLQAT